MSENKINFRSDINGLRAVAVISVLLFHFTIPPFGGGFVGVDVFFVISGFLMTSIVVRGLAQEKFNLPEFYLNRFLRIVPALIWLVVALLIVGALVLLPDAARRLSSDSINALSFLINIKFSQDTGYFGDHPSTSWLLHCWSLAVEFQFYLIFPVAAWLAWRLGRRTGLVALLLATILISLPFSYFETAHSQMSAFYLLPSRAWEFALGGLVAMAPPMPRALSRVSIWAGLALIITAILLFDGTWIYPSFWPIIPVAGAALVILANGSNPVLENPFFQFLGNISYSLYLWHWPVICIARYYGVSETPLVKIIYIAVSIALGWFSFRYLEVWSRHQGWRAKIRSSSLLASVSIAVGLAGMALSSEFVTCLRVPSSISELVEDSIHTNQFRDGVCFLGPDQNFSELAPECISAKDQTKPSLMIWGDSHAAQLYSGIVNQPWSANFNILQITASACPPLQLKEVGGRPFCPEIERRGLESIEKIKPHAVLIAGGVLGLEGDANDARRDADKAPQLAALVKTLLSEGVSEVYVMGRLPKWRIAQPQLVFIRNRTHTDELQNYEKIANASIMPSEDRALRAVTEAAGGKYISIADVNCINEKCLTLVPTVQGRALTQFDTEHLTTQGADWVASRAIGPALGFPAGSRLEIGFDELVTFSAGTKGSRLLVSGWMPPEGWGTWTIDQRRPGLMVVPVAVGTAPRAVKLTFWGQLAPTFPAEHFSMTINQDMHRDMEVTIDRSIRTEIYELTPEVRAKVAASGLLQFEFMAPEGRSSKSMGLNQDDRVLGFGIREMTLLK